MTALDRELEKLNRNYDATMRVLAAIFQAMQLKESDKIPDDWAPTTMVLSTPQSLNIVARNHHRQSVSIQNQGPSNVLLSNTVFDGPATAELLGNFPLNIVANVALLSSGASFNINTKGPVFGYAVNYGSATENPTATLTIVQNIFAVPNSSTPPFVPGLQWSGILENEEEILGVGGVH